MCVTVECLCPMSLWTCKEITVDHLCSEGQFFSINCFDQFFVKKWGNPVKCWATPILQNSFNSNRVLLEDSPSFGVLMMVLESSANMLNQNVPLVFIQLGWDLVTKGYNVWFTTFLYSPMHAVAPCVLSWSIRVYVSPLMNSSFICMLSNRIVLLKRCMKKHT